jgi:hypothetical protein
MDLTEDEKKRLRAGKIKEKDFPDVPLASEWKYGGRKRAGKFLLPREWSL